MKKASDNEKEAEKIQKEFSEHYQKQEEFLKDERTGFVWLYTQK